MNEEDIKMNSSLLEIPPSPKVNVIMSARKKCLHLCEYVNHFTSRFLCLVLVLAQVHYLDYLLVFYSQSPYWWFILIPDWIAIFLFFAHFTKSYRHFARTPKTHDAFLGLRSKSDPLSCRDGHDKSYFPWWPLAWLIYSITISIKIIVLFTMTPEESIEQWEAKTIQGATGMQTAVGMTSVIFFLMLISNIHRSVSGKMKSFIHEVGATVTIDLLDTMDLLELLYEEEEKHTRWGGDEEIVFRLVLAIVVINMLVPVFPCAIIHRGRTHTSHMFRRLVLTQKVLQIVLVNLLFMSVRLILWSMYGEKFSAFIIKNVLMVGILSTDIFNVYMEAHEEKRREKHQKTYYDTIMGVAAPVKTKSVNGDSVEFEMKEVIEAVMFAIELKKVNKKSEGVEAGQNNTGREWST